MQAGKNNRMKKKTFNHQPFAIIIIYEPRVLNSYTSPAVNNIHLFRWTWHAFIVAIYVRHGYLL